MEIQNRDLKEAAQGNETVDFSVVFNKEGISKAGNPMITLGLSCTDSDGRKCSPLLYSWLSGSPKASFYIQKFTDALNEDMTISFESDVWIVDMEKLMQCSGKAKLSLNERGYVNAEFLKKPETSEKETIKAETIPEKTTKKPIEITDEDLPF